MEKFNNHLQRMLAAVHLEPVDRVPFMGSGSAVNAALTGVKLSDYCSDMRVNCKANLEGIQMYSALAMHGVPTRLCMFHGENHELSRSGKPKHRLRRLQEMTNWFEKYSK